MMLYMPTIVYSEENCITKHSNELAMLGKKVLIVTGRHSSKENGSLQDTIDALESKNISFVIFNDIEENPSVETVMTARDFGIDEGVDFVIGIGGGSPLDAAKAIALMIANPNKDESVLYDSTPLAHIPVVCVPTTCGTGSEVTPYSILTIHSQRTKKSISHKIYPVLALIDGKYLKTASKSCIINTAVDTLSHLIESYLNTNSNELNRFYSREGLILWGALKETLKNYTVSDSDYVKLMHASMVAGMAIAHTGTSLPHGLSYPVTYELNVPHGKAVGIFLGGYVETYKDKQDSKEVLDLLGFSSYKEFRLYLKELLGPVTLNDELMNNNADSILSNTAKLKNYPFEITKEELIGMLN